MAPYIILISLFFLGANAKTVEVNSSSSDLTEHWSATFKAALYEILQLRFDIAAANSSIASLTESMSDVGVKLRQHSVESATFTEEIGKLKIALAAANDEIQECKVQQERSNKKIYEVKQSMLEVKRNQSNLQSQDLVCQFRQKMGD